MKKKLQALLAKKEARKAELGTKANTTEDIKELRDINTELEILNGEITELRGMIDAIPNDSGTPIAGAAATSQSGQNHVQREQHPVGVEPDEQRSATSPTGEQPAQRKASPIGQTQILATYGLGIGQGTGDEQRAVKEKAEQRGADLKAGKAVVFKLDEIPEFRAVNIGGGTLVVPKHYKQTLAEGFSEVSGLIDVVNAIPLEGGESYEAGFVKSYGEGGYSTETGDYTESDPQMDYVSVGKAKITVYTEVTDETRKLPNIDYQSVARRNVLLALRKKIARQIVVGAGTANTLTGIFNVPTKVIPTASDLLVSEIDADTLDKIVFGYGGDEDVEGGAYLILSKTDLAAFAAIRGSDGKKLYTITLNGNVGTISSDGSYRVNFIINSACPALSAAGTAVDTYCMAYGMPAVYEMPIFSPVEIMESREYKFRSGQIAFRGVVWVGGNVTAYKGFVRIKKTSA